MRTEVSGSTNSQPSPWHHAYMRCPGWALTLYAFALLQRPAWSQAPAPPLPDAPSATVQGDAAAEAQRRAAEHAEGEREVQTEERQRLLVVVPNFNTVIGGQGVRLSPGQKTRLAVRATLDPFNVVGAFVFAGVNEIQDDDRGYGWGPAGYFKRVGANYLDVVDGTMLAGAAYPILLHQDPRFFRQGTGRFRSRLLHALGSSVVGRGDNGRREFNFSNVLGNYTAGALSNLYYPADTRGVSHTLINGGVVTAEGSLGAIGLEFAPDVADWFRQRKHPAPTNPSGSAAVAPGVNGP